MENFAGYFLQAYDGFADRRFKNQASGAPIRIDDRTASDCSNTFCTMFARIVGPNRLKLSIQNLPIDETVSKCLKGLGATNAGLASDGDWEILLGLNSAKKIRQLATAVRRVAGRGRRYGNRNWKWICPRASGSLNRLADVLEEYTPERIRGFVPV
jgi:hypothetical protein